jgi:hypothetical protein
MCRVILMRWDWMSEGKYRGRGMLIHFWLGDGRDDGWDVEKFLAVVFG